MLNNAKGFNRIYIATGYTDLRRGIEGLSGIIEKEFHLDPFDRNTLFLFCGKRNDRIKGLLWEGDGFLLLYKRLDNGKFQWPRTESDEYSRPFSRTCPVTGNHDSGDYGITIPVGGNRTS